MLKTIRKFSRAIFGALVCTALVCCVQFEQKTTLYPDGSGKIEMLIAMKEDLAKMAEGEEDDPFEDFKDPLALAENTEGFVAWTAPTKKIVDGWLEMRVTGYFEDVTKAKFYDERGDESLGTEDQLSVGFTYKEEEGLHTLSLQNDMANDMPDGFGDDDEEGDEADEMAEAMMGMMKEMMEGLRIEMAVTVPGKIETVKGLVQEGRTAKLVVDSELMFGADGETDEAKAKRKAMLNAPERIVTWRGSETSDEDVAAFKMELEAAKAAWEKALAVAKAK